MALHMYTLGYLSVRLCSGRRTESAACEAHSHTQRSVMEVLLTQRSFSFVVVNAVTTKENEENER